MIAQPRGPLDGDALPNDATVPDPTMRNRLALAYALMGNGATGAYSGIANAGSSLLGAALASRMQNQSDPMAQEMVARGQVSTPQQAASILHPSFMNRAGNYLSNLFGLGDG